MAKKSEVVSFPLERTRNIGIIAHIDAGKTTTTERILYYTGRQHRLGNVDEGNTTTDWLEQERERGITIVAAAVTTHWNPRGQTGEATKHRINIIDTPGHVDFTAEVERSLRVLDGAVVVVSGVEGVQAQTETVWKQANRHHVPRILFVNKLDRIGADFNAVFQDIEKTLEAHPVALQIPIGQEKALRGVVDLIQMKGLVWQDMEGDEPSPAPEVIEIPADLKDDAEIGRIQMLERIADHDEQIAEKYLAEQEITAQDIRAAVRRLAIALKITPVLCGASQRCKGVQPILDAICDFLPAPIDLPPVKGKVPKSKRQVMGDDKDGGGDEVPDDWADGERKPDPKAPFCALAFKTDSDKNTELTYLRIYSGTIDGSTQVLNVRRNKRERLSQIFLMHANKREQLDQAVAGEIVAAVGLRFTRTGDTLADPNSPIVLGAITFPEPVISMSVEPVSTADKDALDEAIERFAKNDPTFSSRIDRETGQRLISGMGELHLDIIRDRILREWNVKAKVGKPRVAFRQTVSGSAEKTSTYQMSGQKPLFAKVALEVAHRPRFRTATGAEVELPPVSARVIAPEDQIPKAYHKPIEDAILSAAQGGPIWGYPMIDVMVTVKGGQMHPIESTEGAFVAAATMAFRDACEAAGVVLLEPIMDLEVETPAESVGNIIRDLNARHAEILGDEEIKSGIHQIRARVPLAAMVGYSTDVRSMSQGRATFQMEPAAYAEVPEERRPKLF